MTATLIINLLAITLSLAAIAISATTYHTIRKNRHR